MHVPTSSISLLYLDFELPAYGIRLYCYNIYTPSHLEFNYSALFNIRENKISETKLARIISLL
jgi:hypothetical protein